METRKTNSLKCLLVLLNTILMCIGLALVGLIAFIRIKHPHLDTLTGCQPLDITIIIVAGLLCLVALLGYCAVASGHLTLLKVFMCFVLFLIVVEVILLVFVFTQQDMMKNVLRKLWDNVDDKNRIEFQKVFSCCGIDRNITHDSNKHASCFVNGRDGKRKGDCIKALTHALGENFVLIAGFSGGVVLVEIMIMLTSCILLYDQGGGSRVVPMTINVRPSDDMETDTFDNYRRIQKSNWAKHSLRTKKPQT